MAQLPDHEVALPTLKTRQRQLEKQIEDLRRPALEAQQKEAVMKGLRELRRIVKELGGEPVA